MLILGNGPSLKKEFFPLISNTPCLGMNAAYRYWQRIGWYPEAYCCLDNQVVLSHADAIRDLIENQHCRFFFLHPNFLDRHPDLANASGVYFLPQLMAGESNPARCTKYGLHHTPQQHFRTTQPRKLTTGAFAARFANFLGYRKLGLIGIDCRYTEIINEAKKRGGISLEIGVTPQRNPNYFFDDYQVRGDVYNIPNPDGHDGNLHLQALEALRDDIATFGLDMEVQVCTPESELFDQGIFPYQPITDFVSGPKLSAVFVPFVSHDLERLTQTLKRWGDREFAPYRSLPKAPTVELHLAFNGQPSPELEETLSRVFFDAGLCGYFSGLHFHYSALEGLRDLYTRKFQGPVGPEGYMAGPNNQFFDIIQKFSVGMSHIVLLEPDAIPIRANWLAAIEDLVCGSERFWICGSHYRGIAKIHAFSHINGNAIYNVGDPAFQRFIGDTLKPHFLARVREVPRLCYDVAIYDLFEEVFTGVADAQAFGRWSAVAHRFRFSEVVVDVSHPHDRLPDALLSLRQARSKYPDAYLYHGAIAKIEETALSGVFVGASHRAPSPSAGVTLVMIDPDALGQFGHYLAYDDQLDAALRPYADRFVVLANKKLPASITESRRYFLPCLTDHSWTLGNPKAKPQAANAAGLKRFQAEVVQAIQDLRQRQGVGAVRLYMYCAGVPHALAMSHILDQLPQITGVVNLFYLPFHPFHTERSAFAKQWLPSLRALAADARLTVNVPTDNLAQALRDLYGLELAAAPHPSPTISDSLFARLQRDRAAAPEPRDQRTTVLFPGAPTQGKNIEVAVAAANHLVATRSERRVVIRDLRRDNTTPQQVALFEAADSRLERLKGQLSNREFLRLFQSADILVLPYTPEGFRYRNSGLLIDAVYCGKPVVVVKQTWLGDFVERYGCGVAINTLSVEAIAAAVTRIEADLERFSQRAAAAAKGYYPTNSWDGLARLVMSEGSPRRKRSRHWSVSRWLAGLFTSKGGSRGAAKPVAAADARHRPALADKTAPGNRAPGNRAGLRTEAPLSLAEANRLLRLGEPAAALPMYLQLHEQQPLSIYANNALHAARKLGMTDITSIDQLRRQYRDEKRPKVGT
ncbi:glycosyltransferase [Lamprobacter modestohalophilus]|nr:glycosyltransferase [Lamprobacter modestohalophilus]